jgi:hypothetical protein
LLASNAEVSMNDKLFSAKMKRIINYQTLNIKI